MTHTVFVSDEGLTRYLQRIRKFPLLTADEEVDLARRWQATGDREALGRLVASHLRLVARMANDNRGYGLPVAELISEGNMGLMQAVLKFDPERGFRLSTYTRWWIRAAIQEYILRSWSLVRMGTTGAQKKLFFNLRRIKARLQLMEEGDLPPDKAALIAKELGVADEDVIEMNRRLASHDQSLNAPTGDADGEQQDFLVFEADDQEVRLAAQEEMALRRQSLHAAMAGLTTREREIFTKRRLHEDPPTLAVLSKDYCISRERVRQIEAHAFEKIQAAMRQGSAGPSRTQAAQDEPMPRVWAAA